MKDFVAQGRLTPIRSTVRGSNFPLRRTPCRNSRLKNSPRQATKRSTCALPSPHSNRVGTMSAHAQGHAAVQIRGGPLIVEIAIVIIPSFAV